MHAQSRKSIETEQAQGFPVLTTKDGSPLAGVQGVPSLLLSSRRRQDKEIGKPMAGQASQKNLGNLVKLKQRHLVLQYLVLQ